LFPAQKKGQEKFFEQSMIQEIAAKEKLKKIDCEYIGLPKVVSKGDQIALYEFYRGGTLASKIKKGLSEQDLQKYAIQLMECLSTLHDDAKIVHLDIKPDNILLHNGKIKVIDFEMWQKKGVNCGPIGTGEYCSPEILAAWNASQIQAKPSHDLWAAGISLYEMVYKKTPVSRETCVAVQNASEKGGIALQNAQSAYQIEFDAALKPLKAKKNPTPIDKAILQLLSGEPTAKDALKILKGG